MEYLKKVRSLFVLTSSVKPFSSAKFKSETDATPLGLPFFLFLLYSFSGPTSFVLLVLSLLDLGYFSFWLIPPLSFFTLVSLVALLFLARAPRTKAAPSYFSTLVACTYLLALAWFVAFVTTLVVAATKGHRKWYMETVEDSGAAGAGTQIAQIVLSCLQFGLLATFATVAHWRVINAGEPESWRPAVPEPDKTIIGLSTVVFDSRIGNHDEAMQVISGSAEK